MELKHDEKARHAPEHYLFKTIQKAEIEWYKYCKFTTET